MISAILSTQEVASMINVTETTVKRWADEGKLNCAKTLGGHRKFKMKDIVAFAEVNGYPLSGVHPPPMTHEQKELLQFGVITRNYKKVADVFLEEALQGDASGLQQLLQYLYKNHISMGSIADEVIRPALVRIGEMWYNGTLGIEQEHIASNAITEALIRFAPEIHHKGSNGLTALCACPEGEYHEIGLRSFSYVLESEGWSVYYVGANTPFDTIQSFMKTMQPNVVCLSFTVANKNNDFFERMKSLGRYAHSYKAQFIVGGFYSGNYNETDFDCDRIIASSSDAVAYLKDVFKLKPGPKKALSELRHERID